MAQATALRVDLLGCVRVALKIVMPFAIGMLLALAA